jgi:hypothetical protein
VGVGVCVFGFDVVFDDGFGVCVLTIVCSGEFVEVVGVVVEQAVKTSDTIISNKSMVYFSFIST